MNTATSFEQLQMGIQDLRSQTGGDIVIHGTPRVVQIGDTIEPRVSRRPARDENNADISWNTFEPYVFGAYPEYPDVATFTATVMGVAPPYTAGIWEDPAGRLPIRFMANGEVRADVKRLDPVGTVCALPSKPFTPSPRKGRFEVVSVEPVRVIASWLVRHSVLSFDLDTLPPLTIPGLTEEELATLASLPRL